MNVKGYRPTGIKPIELGGLGKQIRIDEILREGRREDAGSQTGYPDDDKGSD